MNYFEEMVLNGVLEILHSEFMIQHVCDGKALRNKLGDSDEKHPDQIRIKFKTPEWQRCNL